MLSKKIIYGNSRYIFGNSHFAVGKINIAVVNGIGLWWPVLASLLIKIARNPRILTAKLLINRTKKINFAAKGCTDRFPIALPV